MFYSKSEIFWWIISVIVYFFLYVANFIHEFKISKNNEKIDKKDLILLADIFIAFVPGINIAYIIFRMSFNKEQTNFTNTFKYYLKLLKDKSFKQC